MENRRTFVLWISRQAAGTRGLDCSALDGRLEDVDTGREVRFRSVQQLIAFLEETLRQGNKASVEGN